MKVDGFVITLARAKMRKEQVEKICQDCPVDCHVIDAVDGSQLSHEERSKVVAKYLYWPRYPFRLRDGEVGVFLSHRKAWQEIVNRQLDAGLILEDDVAINTGVFRKTFQLGLDQLDINSYIKLPVPHRGRLIQTAEKHPTNKFTIVTPLGATSQLVGRASATRLLELTERFDRPIDAFLQMDWQTKISPSLIIPSGIEEISHLLGGSTIQTQLRRSKADLIFRNIIRPIYRAQIFSRSCLYKFANRNRNTAGLTD